MSGTVILVKRSQLGEVIFSNIPSASVVLLNGYAFKIHVFIFIDLGCSQPFSEKSPYCSSQSMQ